MTTPALAVSVRGKGRHYKNMSSERLVPSVTNVLNVLDKPALPRWAASETAKAAAQLKTSLAGMEDEDIISTLKGAPWRKSTRAAERGTSIHEWLEKAMLGEKVSELEGEAIEYEQAAHAWLDAYKPKPVRLEATMFSERYAGTADGIVEMGGEVWLIDFKTSKGLYESAALQLAALSKCPEIAADEGTEPAPKIDRVAAVRIGRDGEHETLEVVDIEEHYKAFVACLDLWEWKTNVKPFGGAVLPTGVEDE